MARAVMQRPCNRSTSMAGSGLTATPGSRPPTSPLDTLSGPGTGSSRLIALFLLVPIEGFLKYLYTNPKLEI